MTDPSKIKNRIERRAALLCEAIEDRAKRLVAAMDEPPIRGVAVSPDVQRRMWSFSPSAHPDSDFWALVDLALASGMTQSQAEEIALREVYPYRATLCGIGTATLEYQVAAAERISRLIERDAKEATKSNEGGYNVY